MCTGLDEKKMKVSIIVPMYNAEKYIERCVDSVLRQTNPNWELILVNDGSTDNTLSIANRYTETDKRIRLIDGVNQGVSCARNKGITAAEGQITIFLDSDDWIEDCCVDIILKNWENNLDVVVFDYYESNEQEGKKHMCCFDKEYYDENDAGHFFLLSLLGYYECVFQKDVYRIRAPWAKAYNTSAIQGRRSFLPTVKLGEDAAFNIQTFLSANKVKYVDCAIYNYYINPTSTVRQIHYDMVGLVKGAGDVLRCVYVAALKRMSKDPEMHMAWHRYVFSWMKVCMSRLCMLDDWEEEAEARYFLRQCATYLESDKCCNSLTISGRFIVHLCANGLESVIIKILGWRK